MANKSSKQPEGPQQRYALGDGHWVGPHGRNAYALVLEMRTRCEAKRGPGETERLLAERHAATCRMRQQAAKQRQESLQRALRESAQADPYGRSQNRRWSRQGGVSGEVDTDGDPTEA